MLLDREFQANGIDILGAFSKEAFALAAYSDRAKAAIDEITFGLDNNDLAIMMGGGSKNPFDRGGLVVARSEEHTSELQSLMRIPSAVFCLQKKNEQPHHQKHKQDDQRRTPQHHRH